MRRASVFVLIFINFLFMIGCSNNFVSSMDEGYNVKFIVDEEIYSESRAVEFRNIVLPEEPKKPVYLFKGWFYDKDIWSNRLDTSKDGKLTNDIELYAYFEYIDTRDIINDFSVPLIGSDKLFKLSENMDKINIINIWYAGCIPCIMEMPLLDDVAFFYRKYVNVIAIHEESTYNDEVVEFINNNYRKNNIIFAKDYKDNPIIQSLGGGEFYPITLFVNKEGRIAYSKEGAFQREELFLTLKMVLEEYNWA